jgi:hypothetical protein
MGEGRAPKVGPLEGRQEQLPRDAVIERTGMYLFHLEMDLQQELFAQVMDIAFEESENQAH